MTRGVSLSLIAALVFLAWVGCTYDYAKFDSSESAGAERGAEGNDVMSSEPGPGGGGKEPSEASAGSEVVLAGGSSANNSGRLSNSSGGSAGEMPVPPTGGRPEPPVGDGGSAGAPSCALPKLACGATCVDPSSNRAHCGGCDNDCGAQSSNFVCSDGQCGCSAPEDCGGPLNMGCSDHLCVCSGTICFPGEVCLRHGNTQTCSCNGGDPCAAGMYCCQEGCRNLSSDPNHCGGCGRRCDPDQECVDGSCS